VNAADALLIGNLPGIETPFHAVGHVAVANEACDHRLYSKVVK